MARYARRIGNLPAELTSFVGRRYASGELRKKLGAARLVTLVGPGGVGKTRLAIRVATEAARGFSDGVWFAELADVQDASLIAGAVLAGLDCATNPRPTPSMSCSRTSATSRCCWCWTTVSTFSGQPPNLSVGS
jgi:hypothetical protein